MCICFLGIDLYELCVDRRQSERKKEPANRIAGRSPGDSGSCSIGCVCIGDQVDIFFQLGW